MAHGLTLSPGPRNPAHSAAPARPSVAPSSSARLLSALLVIAALGALAAVLGVVVYARVASQLPDPGTLMERAITFRSTRIFDREGGLLYEVQDPNGGKRTTVALDHIAEDLVQATVATEDANFWSHGGIDPFALVRAVVYAVRERRAVSGASTIPEQLVKLTFLTPERTFTRKFKEALLAAEVSRRYSKEDILQLYLNKVFYGNHSYGVQAAARTYFDKSAADLTLAEASLLAGLSQAPAYYDPYTNPERALRRREVVLGLMVERGYATRTEADEAAAAPLELEPLRDVMRAPHFTVLVREHLEEVFGADVMEEMYRAGLDVTTTLDPALQSRAEEIVAQRVTALAPKNVGNGALVAIRPDSGEVVALVGSADWNDESISGQINMATAPRQPGSSLKPFVYIAALEKGRTNAGDPWTTETLVADVPTVFPGGYEPKNYDETEHGLVTVREALANSYNIAAVRTLDDVGVGTFIDLLGRVGITPLTPEGGQFGLGVALGSAEVPLVDSTAAFAALANHGYLERPLTILKVTDADGTAVCGPDADRPCRPADAPLRRKVVDPVHAFLIADVLSDNSARAAAFGAGSALEIGRPAAVKTGTTNDYRDNLTLGFVPGLAVGVWVGNADREPMRGVSGITGAAPIWHDFMIAALEGVPVEPFTPPQGVQKHDVCTDTGTAPGPACPAVRSAWFPADRPPLPPERDLWQMIGIDRDSGLRAAPGDTGDHVEQRPFKVYPPELATWAVEHGIPQPPAEIAPPPPEDDEEEETAEATATTVITPTVVVTATVPFSPTVAPTFTPWLVLTPPTPEATPDFVTLTPEPTSPPEPTVEPTYTPESTARDRPTAATRRADAVSGWRSVRGAGPSVSASSHGWAWARRWASGSPR